MTRIGRFVVFALASIALAAVGSARNPDATRLSRVETYLRERYPDSLPGVVVGIVSAGRLVHVSAHGLADVEARVPMSRGTRFNVMSLAKQFTAAAVGLLVLRGELSLNDDVRRYVPELPDYGVPIRIRDLVHHTSGLRDVHTLWILAGGSPEDARGRTAHLAMLSRQRGLNFTPGTEYLYSNSGYILLALVVERVSGLSFPEYARRNLFAPLGMKDSEFAVPEPGDAPMQLRATAATRPECGLASSAAIGAPARPTWSPRSRTWRGGSPTSTNDEWVARGSRH